MTKTLPEQESRLDRAGVSERRANPRRKTLERNEKRVTTPPSMTMRDAPSTRRAAIPRALPQFSSLSDVFIQPCGYRWIAP